MAAQNGKCDHTFRELVKDKSNRGEDACAKTRRKSHGIDKSINE